ncbi:hypothetical protein D0864_13349 [Hortaea werneckii]|uniref:Uncharacterized protein n=1 Tax=Hortaea werneckii TaxID=91943 RepID=A0A3M7D2W2_HORWE|nr:hypothetical protein D0864_13349 [Hortaea werneckii]
MTSFSLNSYTRFIGLILRCLCAGEDVIQGSMGWGNYAYIALGCFRQVKGPLFVKLIRSLSSTTSILSL